MSLDSLSRSMQPNLVGPIAALRMHGLTHQLSPCGCRSVKLLIAVMSAVLLFREYGKARQPLAARKTPWACCGPYQRSEDHSN